MAAPIAEPRKSPFRSLRLAAHRLLRRRTTRLDGLVVLCDPARLPRSVCAGVIKGDYELPERLLVRRALAPGHRVLEVGCGIGVVGLTCARIVGDGNLLSYEANVALEPIIRENFALNGREANLRMRAVTPNGEAASLYRDDNVVSSSVFDRRREAERVTVPGESLDAALAGHRAEVLVMDVEGAEVELLAASDLSGLRHIVLETHPHVVGEEATLSLLGALRARGFREEVRMRHNLWLARG